MAQQSKQIVFEDFPTDGDWKNYTKWYAEQIATIQTNKDPDAKDLTGSLLEWPRADGEALYVVTKHKPLTIAHVRICDAWTIEPALIRGLREADVREQLRRAQGLSRLFGH